MGTVVFSDSRLKIYMEASPEERARRRLLQRGDPLTAAGLRSETERLLARDTHDSERAESPLRKAPDALVVDTTKLGFEDQVELIVSAARSLLDIS
jgi:cytidylate kinase